MGEDCGIQKAMLDSDIVKMPPVERMTPLGFLRFSSEYLRAATIIHQKDPTLITPVYFLACHSIELAMKAYLLARGQKLAHLKNALRHDLEALHKLAITQSPPEFPSSPEKAKALEMQKMWTQQIEAEQVSDPFLRDALKEIVELHFDKKFYPTMEDVYLWVYIEKILNLKAWPFYARDLVSTKKEEKLYELLTSKDKETGAINWKNFKESTENYRMYAKLGPLLKQMKNISEINTSQTRIQ